METKPLVSVITPNYNGERFIKRAIECVRRQSFSVEHIIVDDCSSDGSWDLLLNLAKKYSWLKPLRLDENLGPVEARNLAIKVAKGRFLAFLDIDDFWLPHKLHTQVMFMLDNNCALSFSDYRFVTEDGEKVGYRLKGFNKVGWHLHHMTRYLGCLTIILDREKLTNFRFPEITPAYRAEDFLAWSECLKKTGAAVRCPYDLARYSVVSNSRSSNARRAARSVWRLYRDVEKISFLQALIYFSVYALGVIWKRYKFRPRFNRDVFENDYDWSVLK